jgi:hypothetical protein
LWLLRPIFAWTLAGPAHRMIILCCARVPVKCLLKHDISTLFEMQENAKQMGQTDFEQSPSFISRDDTSANSVSSRGFRTASVTHRVKATNFVGKIDFADGKIS